MFVWGELLRNDIARVYNTSGENPFWQLMGHELEVKLKTEDWREQLEEEMALCGDTTVPLIDETLDITDVEDSEFSIRNIEGKLLLL